jgi:hypothetical protein
MTTEEPATPTTQNDFVLASSALAEYGYEPQEDGSFVRSKAGTPRDKWVPALRGSGFLRFTRNDGKWDKVPYTIAAKWANVSGLTSQLNPECYEYVYPADYVLNIYATALTESV